MLHPAKHALHHEGFLPATFALSANIDRATAQCTPAELRLTAAAFFAVLQSVFTTVADMKNQSPEINDFRTFLEYPEHENSGNRYA